MIKIIAGMLIAALLAQASIQNRIQSRSQQLAGIQNSYKQMDSKLASIAQKIGTAQNKKQKLTKAIKITQKELAGKEAFYEKTKKRYAQTKQQLQTIKEDKQKQQKELEALIVKEFGLMMALQNSSIKTREGFVNSYVFKQTGKYTRKKITALNDSITQMDEKKQTLSAKSRQLETIIGRLEDNKQQLIADKQSLENTIASLKKNRKEYKDRLTAIREKKSRLSTTLQELKVVAKRQQKEKEAKRQAAAKRALEKKDESLPKLQRNDKDIEVRQIGSSYYHDNLYRYRGPKTISPLESASITRNFGTYTDPVYNIKIFNESVVLKPKSNPANVRNVLNGEVLYAQETNMLGNVVIVKHPDSMHTIYAGLSKIAPGIRSGKRVAKGMVIGRVKDELTFEATKNSRHLNPVRLISLR